VCDIDQYGGSGDIGEKFFDSKCRQNTVEEYGGEAVVKVGRSRNCSNKKINEDQFRFGKEEF
jgi:hypothetical protein